MWDAALHFGIVKWGDNCLRLQRGVFWILSEEKTFINQTGFDEQEALLLGDSV